MNHHLCLDNGTVVFYRNIRNKPCFLQTSIQWQHKQNIVVCIPVLSILVESHFDSHKCKAYTPSIGL